MDVMNNEDLRIYRDDILKARAAISKAKDQIYVAQRMGEEIPYNVIKEQAGDLKFVEDQLRQLWKLVSLLAETVKDFDAYLGTSEESGHES